MEEIVVNKGYYMESRRTLTGNVGRVTSKEIERQPVSNPLATLVGRVAGLDIVQESGLPGNGVYCEDQRTEQRTTRSQ
jgi:hypothetical protein